MQICQRNVFKVRSENYLHNSINREIQASLHNNLVDSRFISIKYIKFWFFVM